jgi:hypothetical protein
MRGMQGGRALSSQDSEHPAGSADNGFRVGLDDVVIVPLVAVAFAVWTLLRGTFFLLVDIVDFSVPDPAAIDAISIVHAAHCR